MTIWTDLAPIVNGQFMKSSFMNAALRNNMNLAMPVLGLKLTDESVTSNTVVQDDNNLFFPVAAGQLYAFRLILRYVAAAAGVDLKLDMGKPLGAEVWAQAWGHDTALAAQTIQYSSSVTSGVFDATTTSRTMGVAGLIYTTTTAGNFQIKWAQNTSSASAMTVRAGSILMGVNVGANPLAI